MSNPEVLTINEAVAYYACHGITRGRSKQTLARMRMGDSKITGPEYTRLEDGTVLYFRDSVESDIQRILGLPRFTSVSQEKAAGMNVPNANRDYAA